MSVNLPHLIGLAGAAGAGKDTLADWLVANRGYLKMSFADPIKQLVAERFGFPPEAWNSRDFKDARDMWFGARARRALVYGELQGTRAPFSPRSWAQWLGTDVVRMIDPAAWVKLWERRYGEMNSRQRVVVPDVRFDNEAVAIHNNGGVVVLIVLPGHDNPAGDHVSEDGVSPGIVDGRVTNTLSPEFFDAANHLLSQMC